MNCTTLISICLIATASLSASASAGVVAPFDSTAKATFVSSDASYTGEIVFLGVMPNISWPGVTLFNNHAATPGDMFDLGSFSAGDDLVFGYRIDNPETLFAMNASLGQSGTPSRFYTIELSESSFLIHIKDTRFTGPGGKARDKDFNDTVFRVDFCPVPAPGTAALAGIASLVMLRRRR